MRTFMRDQVFISYSHRDKKFMEELLTHLKPLLRSGSVKAWSDQQIATGSQWFDEIQTALQQASAAVLLVSPDFLASDFIHEHELGPILKEAEKGGVRVLWVPIQASNYKATDLEKYQAVSPPDVPLGLLGKAERNQAWVRVCQEIKKAVSAGWGVGGCGAGGAGVVRD
jgi:internalin A